MTDNLQPPAEVAEPMLNVLPQQQAASGVTASRVVRHDVFQSAELLTRLLMHQTELGYKLVTFYTASVTAYIALAGFTASQFFGAVSSRPDTARSVAIFGLIISILSIAAPFGLNVSLNHVEKHARLYAQALSLPEERFTVVRFGTWASLAVFVLITIGWVYLLSWIP